MPFTGTWAERLARLDDGIVALETDATRAIALDARRRGALDPHGAPILDGIERALERACEVRARLAAYVAGDALTAPSIDELHAVDDVIEGGIRALLSLGEALLGALPPEVSGEVPARTAPREVTWSGPSYGAHARALAARLRARRRQIARLAPRFGANAGLESMDARAEEVHTCLRRASAGRAPLDEVERMIETYEQDVLLLLARGLWS